jgi:hypothetical protein
MPEFRRFCKYLVIFGILTTCGLAETLSAPSDPASSIPASSDGIDILNRVRDLFNNRKIDEAKALLTGKQLKAIGKNNPLIDAAILNDLGVIFDSEGMFRDAESAYSRAIGLVRHAGGEDTPAQIDPVANLANLLYESSQFSRAEILLTREIKILNIVSASGEFDKRSAIAQGTLAKVYLGEHKYSLAAGTAQNLIKVRSGADQTLQLAAALGYSVLGAVSTRQGQLPAAETSLREAISILESALDSDDVRISEGIANMGLFYVESGDPGRGEPLLEDAHARLNASRFNSLFRRSFLLRFADVERRSGNKKKAKELLNEARSLAAGSPANSLSQYIVDVSAWRQ